MQSNKSTHFRNIKFISTLIVMRMICVGQIARIKGCEVGSLDKNTGETIAFFFQREIKRSV